MQTSYRLLSTNLLQCKTDLSEGAAGLRASVLARAEVEVVTRVLVRVVVGAVGRVVGGRVRADGRVVRDLHLAEVHTPVHRGALGPEAPLTRRVPRLQVPSRAGFPVPEPASVGLLGSIFC